MRGPTSAELALHFALVAFGECLVYLEDSQDGLGRYRGGKLLYGRACCERREGQRQQRPAAGSVLAWRGTWKFDLKGVARTVVEGKGAVEEGRGIGRGG